MVELLPFPRGARDTKASSKLRLANVREYSQHREMRIPFLFLLIIAALTQQGCQTVPENPYRSALAKFIGSNNFDPRKPQLIIIHHTNMASFESALQTLQSSNPHGRVSAHYLISRDGEIVQLVEDHQRAWHAGVSRFQQRADLNSSSMGIELDNDGYSTFPEPQIAALLRLLEDLCQRLGIERHQVWAHADVAPARKDDPNVHFPWQRLAKSGFGLWPSDPLAPVAASFDPIQALSQLGYDTKDANKAALAFNRHFLAREEEQINPNDFPLLQDLARQARSK